MKQQYQHCATAAGALQVRIAKSFLSRALGLLVGAPLQPGEGLLISPCSSIHTLGMRYPIDVVFLDRDGCVMRVYRSVQAGRLRFGLGARGVLELCAGAAATHGLTPGVRLSELARSLAG